MTSESFFSEIESHYKKELPFVVYKKWNSDNISALLQNHSQEYILKKYSECGFVMSPFDSEKNTIIIPMDQSRFLKLENFNNNVISNTNFDNFEDPISKSHHLNLVDKGINAIREEHFQKVVLSRRELINIKNQSYIQIFKNLLSYYPNAFVYCWYHPNQGLWLGASPETLLQMENNKVSTMSLAGTKQYLGTLNADWNEKEILEQQIVTKYITLLLNEELDNLDVSEVKTVRAGDLLHMQTDISGYLVKNNSNIESIIKKLHPTPAVCGTPVISAKQFILDNENYDREYYSGFLGELNFKKKLNRNTNRKNSENNAYKSIKTVSNLFVNLRCVQIMNGKAIVYVGGGITVDSIPENEWKETVEKSKTIKKALL